MSEEAPPPPAVGGGNGDAPATMNGMAAVTPAAVDLGKNARFRREGSERGPTDVQYFKGLQLLFYLKGLALDRGGLSSFLLRLETSRRVYTFSPLDTITINTSNLNLKLNNRSKEI